MDWLAHSTAETMSWEDIAVSVKLYQSVAGASEKVVSLELIDLSIAQSTTEFYSILNFHHEKLIGHFGRRRMPVGHVRSSQGPLFLLHR